MASRSSSSRAWRASAIWPAWGGLKVPPRIPIAANLSPPTSRSSADVPVAFDEVLERAQLAQPDRAAGVQLLGRVADLRPHPELAAVREAGRRVHVHARGVHTELERARGCRVEGDDRLRVAAAVAPDVIDRLIDGGDDRHRERRAEVLRRPVVSAAGSARSPAAGAARACARSSARSVTPASLSASAATGTKRSAIAS